MSARDVPEGCHLVSPCCAPGHTAARTLRRPRQGLPVPPYGRAGAAPEKETPMQATTGYTLLIRLGDAGRS